VPQYFYGTVPSLAWILSHYFYGAVHYSWLATEYYPYRLPNPKSSNPHLIYQDLYQPWRDRDDFDKTINGYRFNLRKGVTAREGTAVLAPALAARLKDICDLIDIAFFYPLVYRVDIATIPATRQHVGGSGLLGSAEVLVPDLGETEFDILFLDDTTDTDVTTLVISELAAPSSISATSALTILEGRC
jgi:hypothetical protein